MRNIRNFFSYAVGDLFVKGILFISLPLLTRIMSPEQYGKLSIINAAVLILYVFVSLNLQSAILNRYMKEKHNFNEYLTSCLIFLIPFHIFLIALSPLYGGYFSKLLGTETKDFKWILLICIFLSYMYIYTSYLQASEKGRAYVLFNVGNKIGEIILLFIFAYFIHKEKYLSKIYAQIAICIPFVLFVWYRFIPFLSANFNIKYIKAALLFGIPLIVHVLSNSLLAQVDRIIINDKLGSVAAGVYSFSYNIGMCIGVFIMAWNSAWQPQLYKLINNNDGKKIQKVNRASSIIIFLVATVLMLFSSEMVKLLSTPAYYEGIRLIPIIIMGNALIHIYLTYVNFVFFNRKTIFISVSTLLALAVNVLANYVLIPIFGIAGSAWATLIAYAFLCVIHYFNAKYNVPNEVAKCINIKVFVFYMFGFFIVYYMVIYVNSFDFWIAFTFKLMITFSIAAYLIVAKPYKQLVLK